MKGAISKPELWRQRQQELVREGPEFSWLGLALQNGRPGIVSALLRSGYEPLDVEHIAPLISEMFLHGTNYEALTGCAQLLSQKVLAEIPIPLGATQHNVAFSIFAQSGFKPTKDVFYETIHADLGQELELFLERFCNGLGVPLLHAAVTSRALNCVRLLLRKGWSATKIDSKGNVRHQQLILIRFFFAFFFCLSLRFFFVAFFVALFLLPFLALFCLLLFLVLFFA